MAENQLTTELVIVDRTSSVLDKIAKNAELASSQMERLIASVELFGSVSGRDFMSKAFQKAENTLQSFDANLTAKLAAPHKLNIVADSNAAVETVKRSVKSVMPEIARSAMEELEAEIARTPLKSESQVIYDMVNAQNTREKMASSFDSINQLFEDMERMSSDASRDFETLNFNKSVYDIENDLEYSMSSAHYKLKDFFSSLNETFGVDITENLGSFREIAKGALEKISQPFRELADVGFKIQGAVGTLQMVFSRITQMAEASDVNTMQNARFNMLANSKGFVGDAATAEAARMRTESFKMASELGMNVKDFSDNLMRFANNSAFGSFSEAADFATLLNKSFIASGSSAGEADSAVRQMLQGLSKGRLGGEDLMSILSAAPQVSGLLERAAERKDKVSVGSYTGQARQLGSDGKLTADVIKDAIFGAREQLEKDFNSIPLTFDTAITQIKNKIEFASQPIYEKFNKLLNSKGAQKVLTLLGDIIDFVLSGLNAVMTVIEPIFEVLFEIIGAFSSGSLFHANYNKDEETTEAVVNQTALMKLQGEKTNALLEEQIDIFEDGNDIFKTMSDAQRNYFSQTQLGHEGIERLDEQAFNNFMDNRVRDLLANPSTRLIDKNGNEYSTAEKFGAYRDENGIVQFRRNVDKLAYSAILRDAEKDYVNPDGTSKIKIRNSAQARATEYRYFENIQKLNQFDEFRAWAGVQEARYNKTKKNVFSMTDAKSFFKDTGAMSSEEYSQVFESGKNYKNINELLGSVEKIRDTIETTVYNDNKQLQLYREMTNENADQQIAIQKIERNTRSMHIDKDSILFMKEMATAEIINRYNSIASSVVQNNTFNNTPSAFRAGNLSREMLRAADGRQLAQ